MTANLEVQRGRSATSRRVLTHSRIDPEVYDELSRVARANDRSIAAEIRRAVAEHVRHERKEQPA
jgi:hypothetical protein